MLAFRARVIHGACLAHRDTARHLWPLARLSSTVLGLFGELVELILQPVDATLHESVERGSDGFLTVCTVPSAWPFEACWFTPLTRISVCSAGWL